MNEIPLREVKTSVRDYTPEAALAFMNLADRDLQLACIERDPTGVAELLGRIAAEVRQTTFINLGVKTVGTSRRGRRKDKVVKPSSMTIAEIELGGIYVEDFFTRSLEIEQMVTFLLAKPAKMYTYADVFSSLISSLLSCPLEKVAVHNGELDRASILLQNVSRFRSWMIQSFLDGNIERLCSVLPAFVKAEVQRLGLAVGEGFISEPQIVISQLKAMMSLPSLQGSHEQMWIMFHSAQRRMFDENPDYIPFGRAVSEGAMTENITSAEILKSVCATLDIEFGVHFDEILNVLGRIKSLTVKAEESLFLRRLGITGIKFSIDGKKGSRDINLEIESEDGYVLDATLIEPDIRGENWVEAYAQPRRMSVQRVYEITAYLEGYLLDLVTLKNISGRVDDKTIARLINLFGARGKREHVIPESVTVARFLLQRAGFVNPLQVEIESFNFPIPSEVIYESGVTDSRRYIVVPWIDLINEDTGEVTQSLGGLYYRTLTYTGISPADIRSQFPRAMIYDISSDSLDTGWEERTLFPGLSISRDWHRCFEILSRQSYVGAIEYVLLQQL